MRKTKWGAVIAGICAGCVNGLLGAGGGMLLVPLLGMLTPLQERDIFPASVTIILPVCLVSLWFSFSADAMNWSVALPYLIGSAGGGIAAGLIGKKIPTKWLHRALGILIVWGGIRYICK